MSRHEQQGDKDKYVKNGHEPNRPPPREDAGGKHGKPDTDDQDDRDMKK
jgi:hypothetical protein